MRALVLLLVITFGLFGCERKSGFNDADSSADATTSDDPRAAQVRSGELPVDYLMIYENGRQVYFGTQRMTPNGAWEPAGPTIVFVIRQFGPNDAQTLIEQGIVAAENTAYLLPESMSQPTLEAMQLMTLIEPIDANMSESDIKAHYGINIK